MITSGELAIICREFIHMITRKDKIQLDDIRYFKSGTGTFPHKLTNYTDESGITRRKTTPYLNTDEFILFDVLMLKNIAGEFINDNYVSHLPFTLIINLYGDDVQNELQYMMSKLTRFKTKEFLRKNKISIKEEPKEWEVLDGKENGSWWIRRRVEINFNAHQVIENDDNDSLYEFDDIQINVETLNKESDE